MFNFLPQLGNQNLLIKVTHNDRITSYGIFVLTRKMNGSSLKKEYYSYVSILKRLLEENKSTLLQSLENDEKAEEFIRHLTFLSNDALREKQKDCLETRSIGFFKNKLQESEFEAYKEKREITFTDFIEVAI